MPEIPPRLCRPCPELACVRCCPPIRPAGHDYLDRRAETEPLLRDNALAWARGQRGGVTDGTSCWGLGYVDEARGLAGCLLHPAVNAGLDLRPLAGWAEKCRRESCPQARVFAGLGSATRAALLDLSAGLDSLAFSSPRTNPIWTLLDWGGRVLEGVRDYLGQEGQLGAYLVRHPRPKARAYLLAEVLDRLGPDAAAGEGFPARFEAAAQAACDRLRPASASPLAGEPFVHRLGLPADLADFLRLGLGLPRLALADLAGWRARLDQAVARLAAEL
jgi:hypothetical protein